MPLTRRTAFTLLAALGVPVAAKAAPEFDPYAEYWLPGGIRGLGADSFAALTVWLNSLPVRQVDGSPTAICEKTGKPYVTHLLGGLARPGDEKKVEAHVAAKMQSSIVAAVDLVRPKRPEDVTFHWRHRLEFEVCDYCEYEPATGRFIQVENWRIARAYCRLTISV
jgi:hypothetical protein